MAAITEQERIVSHPDLDFKIRIRHKRFAHYEGETVQCGDRHRVCVPDQLGPNEVKALAELFTQAAVEMADMPEPFSADD